MITIEQQALLMIEHLADNYRIYRESGVEHKAGERIDDDLLRIYVEDDMVYVGVARRETSSEAWDLFEYVPEIEGGILRMAYFESMYTIVFYDKEWNEVEPYDITINIRQQRLKDIIAAL